MMMLKEAFVFVVFLLQTTEGTNKTTETFFTHGIFYQLEPGMCGSEVIGYLGPVFLATRLNCALA